MSLELSGIDHVSLPVDDLERSTAFYRNVLGLREDVREEGFALFRCGTDLLALMERHPGGPQAVHLHFGFRVDSPREVDRWAERLLDHGVHITQGPEDRDDGRAVYFLDPDGFELEIFYEVTSAG